ncbi:Transcriptional regulatory protein RtcR [Labilithrix luteola]|uniref:Transcriptional regulatory protein RtcR n=1 Tax=Labilithrix luteola TaxID=1391654 RepID=A0A0K1PMD6_9BACT|nr:RNA repair transcriptional activator RtcR [Labilithrix luteola]AKU94566.1 Transcriptional regulatory protein RtcR [Labilithrix luteola]
MPRRKLVVLGLLGTRLDAGRNRNRWERWRPTVSLVQHDDLVVDRLELLHAPDRESTELAEVVANDVAHASPETKLVRHEVGFKDAWDFEDVYATLLDFARSYPFDVEKEDYLVHITTGTHVAQICLFLLTETRYFPARLLQTSPARDREDRAPGSYTIIDLDLSRYDGLASRFHKEQIEGQSFLKSGIETKNAAFNALIERIEHVAIASREPVLVTGPTGAGKSKLARRIYELKKARRQVTGEFAEVNCATLRGDAAMSTLFGHKKGAFTGAVIDRAGLLLKAHQGVLFLDEIGELGLDEQAMLLRAIEEKVFFPMGSDRETSSDFQLLCGTNRDLRENVARGEFREDLFARINLWTFRLPALHERPEDIPPNLDFELHRVSKALGTNVTMNREARERFLAFASKWAWAGNFRDFSASVTRMSTLAKGGRITNGEVGAEIDRAKENGGSRTATNAPNDDLLVRVLGADQAGRLDRFDRVQLADVVTVCASSRSLSEAGRELFASSRAERRSVNDADRLRKYLARFGLEFALIRERA